MIHNTILSGWKKARRKPRLQDAVLWLIGVTLSLSHSVVWAGTSDDKPQASRQSQGSEELEVVEYRVLKNTVLPTRTVESAVYPHLGPHKTIKDVLAAKADLEKAYRDAGYSTVYVDVPEQDVVNGIVRLQVTEGRLDHVQVSGTRYFSNRRILATVPSLEPGAVPLFPKVQQDLASLNRATPDLKVAPVLHPGANPGTVDIDLKVKDDLPLHGSVELNNRYTADTTHDRVVLNLAYDNLFQTYQGLALQYQMAPERPRDSKVLAVTYTAPLAPPGNTLSFLAVKTDSDVAAVGTLSVLGKGHIYGSRYIISLPDVGGFYSNLTFGGDYKKFDQNVLLSAGSGLRTPIAYINWSAVYGGSLLRPGMNANFDLDLNFGVRGLRNDAADFENNRYLSRPNYMYLRAGGGVERSLLWGSRLSLRLSGQHTAEPLISSEQFAIGGADSVRGYLEAEELGDSGATASLELRSPSATNLFGASAQQAYLYAFTDGGLVSILDALPKQDEHLRLMSWGVGLRVLGFHGLDASMDWANPRMSASQVGIGSSRVDFRIRYGY